MTTADTAGPTPPERPGRGRTRAERAARRLLLRANRRTARRALLRARRTRLPSTPPTHPSPPGSFTRPRPFTCLAQLYEEIEREHRQAMYLGGLRLIMFTIAVGISLVIAVPLLLMALYPAGPTRANDVAHAPVRPVAVSAPLTEPTTRTERAEPAVRAVKPTEATRLARPAQAAGTTTRLPQPALTPPSRPGVVSVASAPGRPGAGMLAFAGPGAGSDSCAATGRDGRGPVVHAGPVKVSIAGLDLGGLDALAGPCGDRATARPSSDHDNGSDKSSGKDKNRKDKNRKDKNRKGEDNGGQQRDRGCDACGDPNRDGWAWPSDPRNWPGWRGDGLGPNSGYGYGYGPGYGPSYDRHYLQDRSHQRTHRFDHSRGDANDPGTPHRDPHVDSHHERRFDTGGVCRMVAPGLVRGLPDGGAVCRAIKPQTSHPNNSKHSSPKASPDTSPDTRPKVTPHPGQKTGPNTSPKPGPDTSSKPGPDTRPKASPGTRPDTRPEPKPKGPAQTSPNANPDTRPQPAPQPAPHVTPNDLDHAGGGTNKYGF